MSMVEVRKAERVRAFLRARILFNNGNSTIDCTIKNISASGAKIELSDAVSLPSEFQLDIPQKGRVYRARMMWRDSEAVGVQFLDDEAAAPREITETVLQKLERENRRLKANVALLTKRLEDLGQDVNFTDH